MCVKKLKDYAKKGAEKKEVETKEEERPAAEEAVEVGKDAEGQKDVKLGEFQLREDSVLLIKKTTYMGNDRIDFRVWKDSPNYKGPTKQGFVLPMDKIDDFVKMINEMKKKLEEKA